MNDPAGGESFVSEDSIGNTLYKKDFWSKENLKYSRPHYRLEKSARIINRLARGKRITLLDVGCGPAALMPLLRSNIQYYGIDIAIHDPAPNLIEADLLNTPIRFDDKRFDIVIAQGFFEYVGTFQAQKFAEISQLLNDGGIFIASYVNFGHRDRRYTGLTATCRLSMIFARVSRSISRLRGPFRLLTTGITLSLAGNL